jgi:hypothetical protein
MQDIAECEIDGGLSRDKIQFDLVLKGLGESRSGQPKDCDCSDSGLFIGSANPIPMKVQFPPEPEGA